MPAPQPHRLVRAIDPHPFVPAEASTLDERCREVFSIQTAGLARRIEHVGVKRVVLGLSGGLDSTLALLVCARTFDLLGMPRAGILAVTMPGFGTTVRTLESARRLAAGAGAELREIDIRPACEQHIRDIGLDPKDRESHTFQNLQARERTQVLMDLANREGGIVVGTGDLSEIALGWATFAGDHIAMYGVNASVPKTLVRRLVEWVSAHHAREAERELLRAVLETPVSPELVPPAKDGAIAQKTEDLVGPYELHDFFLFCLLRWGAGPRKILFLAEHAFAGRYDAATLRRWLAVFLRRFFAQQWKRSVMPDGPKVGSVSLSPRGDWRMPSDALPGAWLRELEAERRDPRRGRRPVRPRRRAGGHRPLPPATWSASSCRGRTRSAGSRTRGGSTSWSWTRRSPAPPGSWPPCGRTRSPAPPRSWRWGGRSSASTTWTCSRPGRTRSCPCPPATTGTTGSCGSSTCRCAGPPASPWTWRSREGCKSGLSFAGRALNLSVHGLLLECREPLQVGEDLRFSFEMPGEQGGVQGTGTVVRAASTHRFGVELTHVDGDGRVRIKRYVESDRPDRV